MRSAHESGGGALRVLRAYRAGERALGGAAGRAPLHADRAARRLRAGDAQVPIRARARHARSLAQKRPGADTRARRVAVATYAPVATAAGAPSCT